MIYLFIFSLILFIISIISFFNNSKYNWIMIYLFTILKKNIIYFLLIFIIIILFIEPCYAQDTTNFRRLIQPGLPKDVFSENEMKKLFPFQYSNNIDIWDNIETSKILFEQNCKYSSNVQSILIKREQTGFNSYIFFCGLLKNFFFHLPYTSDQITWINKFNNSFGKTWFIVKYFASMMGCSLLVESLIEPLNPKSLINFLNPLNDLGNLTYRFVNWLNWFMELRYGEDSFNYSYKYYYEYYQYFEDLNSAEAYRRYPEEFHYGYRFVNGYNEQDWTTFRKIIKEVCETIEQNNIIDNL